VEVHVCNPGTVEVEGGGYKFEASLNYTARFCLKESEKCQVPVAHIYNPSYSGGRTQED
jgi:hypothetical protein